MRTQHPTLGPAMPQVALGMTWGPAQDGCWSWAEYSWILTFPVTSPRREGKGSPKGCGDMTPKAPSGPAVLNQRDAAPPRGHFWLSWLGSATGIYGAGGRACCSTLLCTAWPQQQENDPAPNISSAQSGKLCLSMRGTLGSGLPMHLAIIYLLSIYVYEL